MHVDCIQEINEFQNTSYLQIIVLTLFVYVCIVSVDF